MTNPVRSSASQVAASDAALVDSVAMRIAQPKASPADSFVLHAPLELLARAALLPYVQPEARAGARERIAWLGETYHALGDPAAPPAARAHDGPASAVSRLCAAIAAADLDEADAAADWLARALDPLELAAALADAVIPSLGAAAHGSIFLYNLPRIAPRSRALAGMLRGLARELARVPDWRIAWHDQRSGTTATSRGSAHALIQSLLAPPSPGDPGSVFIYPTMSLVDRGGLAAELLDAPTRGLAVADASRALARVAAWSMLQDAPEHAPYGWSHCLTMPQATLGIAPLCEDPGAAVAIAATHALGFRSTLGRVRLDPDWRPARAPARSSSTDAVLSLSASPPEAAAAAWHATDDAASDLMAALATRAAVHEDAHLAKYTLACFDARAADPGCSALYLAAAAYLSAWWAGQAAGDEPLGA